MSISERSRADPLPLRAYVRPVLAGLLVAALGIGPWMLLARRNAVFRPEVPWAALTTLAYLVLLLAWLNGAGWPRRTAAWRRWHLRLWTPREVAGGGAADDGPA